MTTKQDVNVIMDRIESADPESPIAVFLMKDSVEFYYRAIFAHTWKTYDLIKSNPPSLVGIYDKYSDLVGLRSMLNSELYRKNGEL